MLTYAELKAARRGATKVKVYITCPVCTPGRSRGGQRKKSMLTRDKGEGLIGYHCHHGGIDGYVLERGEGRQSDYRATEERRDTSKEEREYALGLWSEAAPIAGTPGEEWLRARGISIADVPDHGGLRFHPRCPANYNGHWRRPSVIARYTDALTGEPKGIRHRSIEPGPYKAMTLGQRGCVVRLWPDHANNFLCVAEGAETALYAATQCVLLGRPLRPMWATGSADNMRVLPPLPDVRTLALIADNDASGMGQAAAEACAERWAKAGRDALVITRKQLGDFNDFQDANAA
jgi:putative DNA primase/helicase